MGPLQRAPAVVVEIALLVAIAALLWRGRWRRSAVFTAYLPVSLAGNVLTTWWPQRFYIPSFWIAKQTLHDVLRLGIALEIGWRTFRVFPGAESTARRSALAILGLTALLVMTVPMSGSGANVDVTTATQLLPRILNGTIWLMAFTLVLAQWYRVPVHPFHAFVLTGFTLYLGLWSTLLRLAAVCGVEAVRPWANALEPPAYFLLVCSWAYLAWRPESETAVSQASVLRRLQFWTTSCS